MSKWPRGGVPASSEPRQTVVAGGKSKAVPSSVATLTSPAGATGFMGRIGPEILKTLFWHYLGVVRERISGPVLCSECFADAGLAIEARKLGQRSRRPCSHCHSATGTKLFHSDIETLARAFFVSGSRIRTDFGGAPRLQFNSAHQDKQEVDFPAWLEDDARRIEEALGVGFFHYGPRLWRLGRIQPLDDLRNPVTRPAAAEGVIRKFPKQIIRSGDTFFRLRANIVDGRHNEPSQYDAPPRGVGGNGRLDSPDFPILYGSQDLEICVHECRVTKVDECYLATLKACQDLNLLNLCDEIENDGKTPFESLYLAIQFIFAAEQHSYDITRAIAIAAKRAGLHGVIYPSYFSSLRSDRIPNIALFGHALADRLVELRCINRLLLDTVRYAVQLGPCLP